MVKAFQRPPGNRSFPARGPQMFPNRSSIPNAAPRSAGSGKGMGGLLQRILSKGNAGNEAKAVSFLPARASASAPAARTGIVEVLNHTQSALKAAESFMPMIQEYGPMVKNLPAMLKMMKALKDIDFDEEETAEEQPKQEHAGQQEKAVKETVQKKDTEKKKRRPAEGKSTPKLFI